MTYIMNFSNFNHHRDWRLLPGSFMVAATLGLTLQEFYRRESIPRHPLKSLNGA